MDEEQLRRDLDAIEKEKKEFLKSGTFVGSEENDFSDEGTTEFEDVETEEMEFSLTEEEIDEWINELTRLKEDKEFILLEVDEENTLRINFQEDSEDKNSEGDESEDDEK
jgi:hypothetical protein